MWSGWIGWRGLQKARQTACTADSMNSTHSAPHPYLICQASPHALPARRAAPPISAPAPAATAAAAPAAAAAVLAPAAAARAARAAAAAVPAPEPSVAPAPLAVAAAAAPAGVVVAVAIVVGCHCRACRRCVAVRGVGARRMRGAAVPVCRFEWLVQHHAARVVRRPGVVVVGSGLNQEALDGYVRLQRSQTPRRCFKKHGRRVPRQFAHTR